MSAPTKADSFAETADRLFDELDETGIVTIPDALSPAQLASMQRAFGARLKRLRWNNVDGYERTERYRHMVHDVLQLDQGFVDVALNATIKHILRRYLGPGYELTEAKGWKSLPTTRDFHGWHGDAWYDQAAATEIHREIKLAIYLTDVKSGAFNYIRGSHRKEHPRGVKNIEVKDVPQSQIAEMYRPAGSVFLFDTSGIHRQGVPMLEPRQACFYNFHDPEVKLEQENVDSYRYHPLILNAAFLGGVSEEDQRILGFGRTTNFIPAYERPTPRTAIERSMGALHVAQLHTRDFTTRVTGRLRRIFG
ncbi:MAG: uncharacterized protein JWM95_5420 [Gemmatimonadetes bacterium]|nr:uncharacterized protein [Gemmatimonadota bacterium]